MSANEAAKGETAREKVLWSDVIVIDSDCETQLWLKAQIAALREFRRTGVFAGFFLHPDDASPWEPAVEDVDWTGFPEEE
jgi:hypothetical protein